MNRDEKGRFTSATKKTETGEEKVYAVGFKGFDPGLICRGKRYAENTVFEEPEAELCNKGMHFCENPLDVFQYYAPAQNGKIVEFATVEALAPVKTDGTKSVTTKLRVGAKLTLGGLIDAAVKFCFERVKWTKKAQSSGNGSAAQSSGDRSAAQSSGKWSAAQSSGNWSAAQSSGNGSAAQSSGNWSAAQSSGWFSQAETLGKESFAVATGRKSKVKGALGCFIACAEWRENHDGVWHPVALISGKVDGETIKADTWYTAKDGIFVEVAE